MTTDCHSSSVNNNLRQHLPPRKTNPGHNLKAKDASDFDTCLNSRNPFIIRNRVIALHILRVINLFANSGYPVQPCCCCLPLLKAGINFPQVLREGLKNPPGN